MEPDAAASGAKKRLDSGFALLRNGLCDEALEQFTKALEEFRRARGDGDDGVDVANTLACIGAAYDMQSRYDEALASYEKALAIFRRVHGENHADVARTLHNMGVVYEKQTKYAEALASYEKALDIRERVLGANDAHVSHTLHELGFVYDCQAKYTEALTSYEVFHGMRQFSRPFVMSSDTIAVPLKTRTLRLPPRSYGIGVA